MEPMNPDQIIEAYKVVAQDVQNRAAEQAARIGNAQRSLGTLAERVASPTGQTSGLANYTYNRLMRPTVDSTAASLTTTGYANALENNLKTNLREAKNRYEDAKNRYTVASAGGGGGGTTTNNNNNTGGKEKTDKTLNPTTSQKELENQSKKTKKTPLGDIEWTSREEYQKHLQDLYDKGEIDASTFISEWWYAENEYFSDSTFGN